MGFPSGACDGGTAREVDAQALMWDLAVHTTWVYGIQEYAEPSWGPFRVSFIVNLNTGEDGLGGTLLLNADGRVVGRTRCGYLGLGGETSSVLSPVDVAPADRVAHDLNKTVATLYVDALVALDRCLAPCSSTRDHRGAMTDIVMTCPRAGVASEWHRRPGYREREHGALVAALVEACSYFADKRVTDIPAVRDPKPTPAWREALESAARVLSRAGVVLEPTTVPSPFPTTDPSPTATPSPRPTLRQQVTLRLEGAGRDMVQLARQGTTADVLLHAPDALASVTKGFIDAVCVGKEPLASAPQRPGYDEPTHGELLADLLHACDEVRDARHHVPPENWEEWAHVLNRIKHRFAHLAGLTITFDFGQRVRAETGDSDRMIVRERPGLDAPELDRVANGTEFVIADGPVEGDGYYWWRFESGGWAADANLAAVE